MINKRYSILVNINAHIFRRIVFFVQNCIGCKLFKCCKRIVIDNFMLNFVSYPYGIRSHNIIFKILTDLFCLYPNRSVKSFRFHFVRSINFSYDFNMGIWNKFIRCFSKHQHSKIFSSITSILTFTNKSHTLCHIKFRHFSNIFFSSCLKQIFFHIFIT